METLLGWTGDQLTLIYLLLVYNIAALTFNAASALSSRQFTVNDPVASSKKLVVAAVVELIVLTNLGVGLVWFALEAIISAKVLSEDVVLHIAVPYNRKHSFFGFTSKGFFSNPSAKWIDPTAWRVAVLINLFGVGFRVASLLNESYTEFSYEIIPKTLLLLILFARSGNKSLYKALSIATVKDMAWYPQSEPYKSGDYYLKNPHKPDMSTYIQMRDGTDIALDLYFPHPIEKDMEVSSFPTFLHLTRYTRSRNINFPFSLIMGKVINPRGVQYAKTLVPRGYVCAIVDVRGTGASGGFRRCDMDPKEIADFQEILDWVLSQDWCSGDIFSGGISYDGVMGMALAANCGKNRVKAVGVICSPSCAYENVCYPGGVPCSGFVRGYDQLTRLREQTASVGNDELKLPFIIKYGVNGPTAVNGNVELKNKYLMEHKKNWDMVRNFLSVRFKDDIVFEDENVGQFPVKNAGISREEAYAIRSNGVSLNFYCGYYDSGGVSAILRYADYFDGDISRMRFTIGPWSHGVRRMCSPYTAKKIEDRFATKFNVYDDLANYFDSFLNEEAKRDYAEMFPVHYYIIGKEEWQSSPDLDDWLHSTDYERLYFSPEGLSETHEEAKDQMISVSFKHTSGFHTRWNLVQQGLSRPVSYDPKELDKDCAIVFRGQKASFPMHIHGIPKVSLSISPVDGDDLIIFAYLQSVSAEGEVRYITEGQIRVGHQIVENGKRSYLRKDFVKLKEGEFVTIVFNMQPISYMTKVDECLQVSLAGSDEGNFLTKEVFDTLATQWCLRYQDECFIDLPIKK